VCHEAVDISLLLLLLLATLSNVQQLTAACLKTLHNAQQLLSGDCTAG
jgi:hypothetical protein